MIKTLNLGAGFDKWGEIKLDSRKWTKEIKTFDLNSSLPLPFKDNTFNQIRLYNTIEFLANPQHTLSECLRVLKKGGTLDILTINAESSRFMVRKLRNTTSTLYTGVSWYESHLSLFSRHTLKNRLLLAGFKRLSISTLTRNFPFKDYLRAVATK